MATITITKQPSNIDMAYGPLVVSTFNSDYATDPATHYIKINNAVGIQIYELRQQPNVFGYAHFDLSKVLQNLVSGYEEIENTSLLQAALRQIYEYEIEYGYIDSATGAVTEQGTDTGFNILYGRKAFDNDTFDAAAVDYTGDAMIPTVGFAGAINTVSILGHVLSDRTYNIVAGNDITDGKPSHFDSTTDVYGMRKRFDDEMTLSWLNYWAGTPLASYNGINGFDYFVYNGSTLLTTYTINNLVSNGGGPNTVYNEELEPTGRYIGITCNAFPYTVGLQTTMTHYYVCPWSYLYDPDIAQTKFYPYQPVRIDINNGQCNDFSPIQFSWVNSYGFKDYFTFEKRNDYSITKEQDTYYKTFGGWSAPQFIIDPYDRGESAYNTKVDETYIANTRYLDDVESTYLKNLYMSPEVKVRFEGDTSWTPVMITSNTWNQKTFRKDKLFQHTIQFKLANKQQIQRGGDQ